MREIIFSLKLGAIFLASPLSFFYGLPMVGIIPAHDLFDAWSMGLMFFLISYLSSMFMNEFNEKYSRTCSESETK